MVRSVPRIVEAETNANRFVRLAMQYGHTFLFEFTRADTHKYDTVVVIRVHIGLDFKY